jgi:protein-S-isoprenylcysteine O-methyltransferase Ste14
MCRVMICASDDCSMIVYESGLREVVLCRDCARFRPVLSSRPWTAPLLALAGLAVGAWVVWQVAAGQISWLQTASGVLSLALLLLACASALARWQWRARLASARERREFH